MRKELFNNKAQLDRLEELQIGLLLGDISPEEEKELLEVAEKLGVTPRPASDLQALVASVDTHLIGERQEDQIPELLAERISIQAREFQAQSSLSQDKPISEIHNTSPASPQYGSWFKLASGWLAASLIFCIWIFDESFDRSPEDPKMQLSSDLESLKNAESGVVKSSFEGVGNYQTLEGEFFWDADTQNGLMTFKGLPQNDPNQNQYQLWIVDPTRDADAPVDGGVFDVTDSGVSIVRMDPKLRIDQPVAFVVTLEKPGGVVKSKQEIVVAVGKVPGSA